MNERREAVERLLDAALWYGWSIRAEAPAPEQAGALLALKTAAALVASLDQTEPPHPSRAGLHPPGPDTLDGWLKAGAAPAWDARRWFGLDRRGTE